MDNISEFMYTYYINPILYDEGYNIINTLTWAIVLCVCIFGVIKLLNKMDVKIDSNFILAIVPFVLAGSSMRVWEDASIIQKPYSILLITPIIYFVVFLITIFCLVIAKMFYKYDNLKMLRAFSGFGIIWFSINIILLIVTTPLIRPMILYATVVLGLIATSIVYLTAAQLQFSFLTNKLNLSILFAHMLDASSTFIGVDMLDYYEKHVLPAYLIDVFGTAFVMYPLKLAIFIPVLYILDTNFNEDEQSHNLKTFVKLVILVLGLSPACRNTIRMAFGI